MENFQFTLFARKIWI
ncbi:DUF321 domain-containing protein [Lacihabitans sp. LS3-19]|nr:DUF321 domain-containing protein [Lacihabitans sp. LS3-19]